MSFYLGQSGLILVDNNGSNTVMLTMNVTQRNQ